MLSSPRRQLSLRASRLVLVPCVILAGGLLLSDAQASAVEGEHPVIDNAVATGSTERSTTLEAQINPGGYETSYEFWLECQNASRSGVACESVAGGAHEQGGHIAAGHEEQTVSVELVGLQPGYSYRYRVAATNVAGKTESPPLSFETAQLGACHNGCPWITGVSLQAIELGRIWAEGAPARQAAREQAAKEQAEREAASRKANQPGAPVTNNQPMAAATGSISLAGTRITVQDGRMSLVKLECLGSAGCQGKLTLSAKVAAKASGKTKRTRAATIGTTSFSIPGDATKTVEIHVDAVGRALLSPDDGRLNASLTILELAPKPENTRTVAIHLIQQRTHTKEDASLKQAGRIGK